jgi:hypothetical protein
MPNKTKSPEQIMKANLGKTLTKMKTKVADREELWLELFQDLIPVALDEEDFRGSLDRAKVKIISMGQLASAMLDEYEDRWGKG